MSSQCYSTARRHDELHRKHKNTDLHQQMPGQNLTPKMVRQGIQHYAVGKDRTIASKKLNKGQKMEVNRTHTEETSNKHHTTSTYMELPREEKKGKAEKHLIERHRKRKKDDGIHRERNGQNGHKLTRVEDYVRWPMLPVSKQAKVSKSFSGVDVLPNQQMLQNVS